MTAPALPETAKTYLARDGARLHYLISRSGTARSYPLVLLHGMASNLTRWSEFVEHTTLARDWDVVRPDLRGHAGSFTRGPIGMRLWCDDLADLLGAEGYTQAVLIGHSLGAHVALEFAAAYPERVAGLVLIDPAFRTALRGKLRWLARLRVVLKLGVWLARALNAVGVRRRVIPARDLRALDEAVRRELLDAGDAAAFVRRYSSIWADLKFFAAAHFLQEGYDMLRPLPSLTAITSPVLVILSSGLTYTDPARTRNALAQLPRLQIGAVDAYHWPLTERPREVRAAIEQWCREHFR